VYLFSVCETYSFEYGGEVEGAAIAPRHPTNAGTVMTARVKRIEQTGRFRAADEHGEGHTLHVFSSLIDAGPLAGLHAGFQGIQSIHTEDGECLDRVVRGEYRTAWGETFRSDDPDAP
jgi:hypothetical protein